LRMGAPPRVFFDSSILLAFLAGEDPRAYGLVEAVEDGEIRGYVNGVVVSEVMHGYLRLATGLSSRRIRQLLARRDERLVALLREDVEPLLGLFEVLPAPPPREVFEAAAAYGLMPSDAVIVATCRVHGVNVIASLDSDFRRVPWLRVIP